MAKFTPPVSFDTGVANIVAMYDSASPADRVAGTAWYRDAHDAATRIQSGTGLPMVTVVGVLAALSPRNKWSRNVADAAGMAHAFREAGVDAAMAVKVCTFNQNKRKAATILQGVGSLGDVHKVLKGQKLRSFFQCIFSAGQTGDCCIDGHAVSIALGERIPLGKGDKRHSLSAKRYAYYQSLYAAAGAARGVSACTMQAVTWTAYRTQNGIA